MNLHFITFGVMLNVLACAPVPEPETPPPVAPTRRSPRREPLLPSPSKLPEVVYAVATPTPAMKPQWTAMR